MFWNTCTGGFDDRRTLHVPFDDTPEAPRTCARMRCKPEVCILSECRRSQSGFAEAEPPQNQEPQVRGNGYPHASFPSPHTTSDMHDAHATLDTQASPLSSLCQVCRVLFIYVLAGVNCGLLLSTRAFSSPLPTSNWSNYITILS